MSRVWLREVDECEHGGVVLSEFGRAGRGGGGEGNAVDGDGGGEARVVIGPFSARFVIRQAP